MQTIIGLDLGKYNSTGCAFFARDGRDALSRAAHDRLRAAVTDGM